MPKVRFDKMAINYDPQGTAVPLILIPHLAADHACYGFQMTEYGQPFYLYLHRSMWYGQER